jgi:hypothetical protein
MKPELQRIAIAEACGWTLVDLPEHPNGPKTLWKTPEGEQLQSGSLGALPDYLTDLNAMHEAETVLGEFVEPYLDLLAQLPAPLYDVRATAAQRAEAFLRTLNLWKP